VISSTRIALSLHEPDDEALGVPAVDGSDVGEPVGGICVGTVNACLVGGRVEVTKRGADGVAVSSGSVETLRQDVNIGTSIIKTRNFFMAGFYF
jgi:hypothetical protein